MTSASVVVPMKQLIVAAAEVFPTGSTKLRSLLPAWFLVRLERINIAEAAYVTNLRLLASLESRNANCRYSRGWTLRRTRSLLKRSGFLKSSTLRFLANRGLLAGFGPFRFHN